MCHHEILHMHCAKCNRDLYADQSFTKDVFCESARIAKRRAIGLCSFFQGTRHVYEKLPEDDCWSCVKKKYEKEEKDKDQEQSPQAPVSGT